MPSRRDVGLGSVTPTESFSGNPRFADLPVTLVAAALWLPFAGALSAISAGPVTLSAFLSASLAALLLSWLPAYATNLGRTRSAPGMPKTSIPLPLWAFLWLVAGSALSAALNGQLSVNSTQNAIAYLLFVGAIASSAAAMTSSGLLVGWNVLRTAATWTTYLWLGVLASGVTTPLSNRSMGMMAVIIVALLAPGTPRNAWEKLAPYGAVGVAIFSLSRTATLVSLVLLSFIAIRRNRKIVASGSRLAKAYLILAGGILAAALAFMFFPPLRNRFLVGDKGVRYGDLSFSTSGRTRIWELLISDQEHWLLGNGLGAAAQLVQARTQIEHPHNEYLRFYFDFGIIGLALFAAGYLTLARRILSNARRTDHPLHWGAFASLVGIAASAVTDNCFVYPYVVLTVGSLAGMSLALSGFEFTDSQQAARNPRLAPGCRQQRKEWALSDGHNTLRRLPKRHQTPPADVEGAGNKEPE